MNAHRFPSYFRRVAGASLVLVPVFALSFLTTSLIL